VLLLLLLLLLPLLLPLLPAAAQGLLCLLCSGNDVLQQRLKGSCIHMALHGTGPQQLRQSRQAVGWQAGAGML
jgi:hypothetical protein